MLNTYRRGVWAHFSTPGPADFKGNFERFYSTVQKIPKEARRHRILSGLNHILAEQLAFVRSLLGANILRTVESDIKKEISTPVAERRKINSKYGLESDVFQVLNDSKKSLII
jgi:hypothetical protein